MNAPPPLGLIGLGVMGGAMARNLLDAGFPLTVYNRTVAHARPLVDRGARVADHPGEVFERSDVVLLVLADDRATDRVLGREGATFGVDVGGTVVVNMATVDPVYSTDLGRVLAEAGAVYVEAPVSGSRQPAEAGELVVLAAGDDPTIAALAPVFDAIGKATVRCGPVPNALTMKLANNLLLIAMLEAVTEAAHFAEAVGLDLEAYFDLVLRGPMANDVLRQKAAQLVSGDERPRAPLKHVLKDIRLVNDMAARAGVAVPVSAVNLALFQEATALGAGDKDVVAVREALRRAGAG